MKEGLHKKEKGRAEAEQENDGADYSQQTIRNYDASLTPEG